MPSYEIAKPPRKLHLSRTTLLALDPPEPARRPGDPGGPADNKRTQQGVTCDDGCIPPAPPAPPKQG